MPPVSSKIKSQSVEPFVKVEVVDSIVPILEKRLPYSVFIYNQAKLYPRYQDCMTFYTLHGETDDSTLIICALQTDDFGTNFSISACEEASKLSKKEAVEVLSNNPLFQWDEGLIFTPTKTWLYSLIFEVGAIRNQSIMEVHPANIFWMDIEQAKETKIEQPAPSSGLVVQPLDPEHGAKFLLSSWKYTKEGSLGEIKRHIERNESGGVYLKGEPVCGVMLHPRGMLSALYTATEHRQKGYAVLAMKKSYLELGRNGIIPASSVDAKNIPSSAFHLKIGCKMTDDPVAYIICPKPEY